VSCALCYECAASQSCSVTLKDVNACEQIIVIHDGVERIATGLLEYGVELFASVAKGLS
jgi:hypothetical protein